MSKPEWSANALISGQREEAHAFAPWFVGRTEQAKAFDLWDLTKPPVVEESEPDPAHEIAAIEEHAEPPEPPGQRLTDEEIAAIKAQALAQGVQQGRAQVEQELAQERAEQARLCQALTDQWAGFRGDTKAWFEPLKRLALQVGAELARAELQLSGRAVEQLVQACAQVLGGTRDHVTVSLNEADWQRLKAMDVQWSVDWHFEVDPKLSVGSVRMSTDDTDVEDLIEHRLSALSRQLLDPHLVQPDPNAQAPTVSEVDMAPVPQEDLETTPTSVEAAQPVPPRRMPEPMAQRAQADDQIVDVPSRDAGEDQRAG